MSICSHEREAVSRKPEIAMKFMRLVLDLYEKHPFFRPKKFFDETELTDIDRAREE